MVVKIHANYVLNIVVDSFGKLARGWELGKCTNLYHFHQNNKEIIETDTSCYDIDLRYDKYHYLQFTF